MTTVESITNSQIAKLSNEAGEAGDLEQVAICERALAGDAEARAECVRVISGAEAQAGDGESEVESEEIAPQPTGTIYERGNGFPEAGDYVTGDDGECYRIVSMGPRIETNGPSNNVPGCVVELADWDDVEESDVHSSSLTLDAE